MKLGKVLGKEGMSRLVETVLAEVDQFYMELPTDADGTPVRLGDKVRLLGGAADTYVTAFRDGGIIECKRVLGAQGTETLTCPAHEVLKVEE